MFSKSDEQCMRLALAYGRRGLGMVGNHRPSVGCVIAKNGHVIAAAWTGDGGAPHAEFAALEKAGSEAKNATAYVTLEPCSHYGKTPPCSAALIEAGISRCVVAVQDPFPDVNGKGIQRMQLAGIQTQTGLLEKEALGQLRGFIYTVTQERPSVTLKCATTIDGKIAGEKGKRDRITGDLAHRHAHLERSMHDAILIGSQTALIDDPLLTCRLPGVRHKGARIVLDSQLKISMQSHLVKRAKEAPVFIFYKDDVSGKAEYLSEQGVQLIEVEPHDLHRVLEVLTEKGITRLLVEGGAAVLTSFLRAGLCDRFLHYKALKSLGQHGVAALNGYDIGKLGRDFNLMQTETRVLDEDLLEIYEPEG